MLIKEDKLVSKKLPDVTSQSSSKINETLSNVGMGKIEMPIQVDWSGQVQSVPAHINAFVSLDDDKAKGIHMSRLYIVLRQSLESSPLTTDLVHKVLKQFVDSQEGLSQSATVEFKFNYLVKKNALKSSEWGWREYPVTIKGILNNGSFDLYCKLDIAYSSTCPCSAALSRQLVKEQFLNDWKGNDKLSLDEVAEWLTKETSIVATPHAQRSYAYLDLKMNASIKLDSAVNELINETEAALGTPVQAAVKRQDEQEFARLNASNLMFCEDAAKKLKQYLNGNKSVVDFKLMVEHQESLHPHNAVAMAVKGIAGGFKS